MNFKCMLCDWNVKIILFDLILYLLLFCFVFRSLDLVMVIILVLNINYYKYMTTRTIRTTQVVLKC